MPTAAIMGCCLQGGEVDSKLLGGLLAGVRRAFPFVDPADADSLVEQHSDALFRIMHTATFGVAVQALSLLFQLLDARSAISDRYYRWVLPARRDKPCQGSRLKAGAPCGAQGALRHASGARCRTQQQVGHVPEPGVQGNEG